MGGAGTLDTAQPPTNEVPKKKSVKHSINSFLKSVWKKKGKNKNSYAEPEPPKSPLTEEVRTPPQPVVAASVMSMLKEMKKLSLNKETGEAEEHNGYNAAKAEMMGNIVLKTIEVKDGYRIPSRSSEGSKDSGVESNKDDDDFVEVFAKVSIEDQQEKKKKEENKEKEGEEVKVDGKKKLQTVYVSRGPVRSSVVPADGNHPYQQIHQVNKQSLSGGQVIVNAASVQHYPKPAPAYLDPILDEAIKTVDASVNEYSEITNDELNEKFIDAETFVANSNTTYLYEDFKVDIPSEAEVPSLPTFYPLAGGTSGTSEPNPIDEFNRLNGAGYGDFQGLPPEYTDSFLSEVILTPPRSDYSHDYSNYSPSSMPSPSLYGTGNSPQTESDYSPDILSPNPFGNGEEPYQELDIPTMVAEILPIQSVQNPRQARTPVRKSSLAMRDIKLKLNDMQMQFSKASCCQDAPDPHLLFKNHCDSLSARMTKNFCVQLSDMDFGTVYGLLYRVLKELSQDVSEKESVQYGLFYHACQQALARQPLLYLGRFGLDLLIAAAMLCPARPELTSLLVNCIHKAGASAGDAAAAGPIFTEVDVTGDTLVAACARGGDRYAAVLAELVRVPAGSRPLFHVERTNIDGYTALHSACMAHNSAEAGSCLRVVHTLLTHAGADPFKGDNKAGDTALHLAVNSVRCDLRLLLALLLHVDRASWNTYAHQRNKSHKTPLDYARQATKSKVRQNYPIEVLDLLLKCR